MENKIPLIFLDVSSKPVLDDKLYKPYVDIEIECSTGYWLFNTVETFIIIGYSVYCLRQL